MDLNYIARFAGVPDGADLTVLEGCAAAAEAWMTGAGAVRLSGDDPLYEHMLANLTSYFYDQRGTDRADIPQYYYGMLNQIRARKTGGGCA